MEPPHAEAHLNIIIMRDHQMNTMVQVDIFTTGFLSCWSCSVACSSFLSTVGCSVLAIWCETLRPWLHHFPLLRPSLGGGEVGSGESGVGGY